MNIITVIVKAVKAYFSPTISDLLGSIAKIEIQIEKAIDKSLDKLNIVAQIEKAAAKERTETDRAVNAAYKLLHKVNGLLD